MKTIKTTLLLFLTGLFLSSCVIVDDDVLYYNDNYTLEDVLQSKDIWYVDYHQTTGNGDVRFMSLAFTMSFINGEVYANNNLVDVGTIGNGYGDAIGFYNTRGNVIEIDHDLDGYRDFEVVQVNSQKIKLVSLNSNVTYTLKGFNRNNFDYDLLFYDNIEYFLQEFEAWKKTDTYGGNVNAFDDENHLGFFPESVNTFRSSQDNVGTNVANIYWDYVGDYEVYDVQGTDSLKVLTLYYDNQDTEEFELSVINDGNDNYSYQF